jgi:DNA-binding PadR family transcriptional regulator
VTPTELPGEFEQMVLLAILRRGDEAYALALVEELERTAGRTVSRGALYRTLDRLEEKGWVRWTLESTTPDRGGHRRRRFRATADAVAALQASKSALHRLWDGLDPILGGRRRP